MRIEQAMSAQQLDHMGETLAGALNRVGADKAPVFLTKLVLMLGTALPRPEALAEYIEAAQQDIASPHPSQQEKVA